MTENGKKFVLRVPGAEPESTAEAEGTIGESREAPPVDTDPARADVELEPEPEHEPEPQLSGHFNPVMISELKTPPKPETTSGDGAAKPPQPQRIGLALLGIGAFASCLFPTLPWFSQSLAGPLKTLGDLELGAMIAGVRTWPGLASVALGIGITVCLIRMLSAPQIHPSRTAALSAAGLGFILVIVDIVALIQAATFANIEGLEGHALPWVALTAAGGVAATVGGLILGN